MTNTARSDLTTSAPEHSSDEVTFAELVAARSEDDGVGLMFGDQSWTWREIIGEARRRAGLAASVRRDGPWHIGLFLENTPEHLFWWLAAGLAGATVVGINPTRRGQALAEDINFTDCQLLVADEARLPLLEGLELDCPDERRLHTGSEAYRRALTQATPLAEQQPHLDPGGTLSLIFTSGTTTAPKAVVCTQGRMGRIAVAQRQRREITRDDVCYVAMPMFHSNAIMAGIAPALSAGASIVLRRKFSASEFLNDVRRYGVTYFNYVGKPLTYILATPQRADDAENPLRLCFGNEGTEQDIARFARRFDCTVTDSYGSSEGEIRIVRVPGTPAGSLGVSDDATIVVDPETSLECPRARFDNGGMLLNPDEAIGEIVKTTGATEFEGYYKNPDAEQERVRNGWVFSGDLAYRDAEGFWYFAGRNSDWLRVDGENIAAGPVERLLLRFDAFATVAVIGVASTGAGDRLMAVVELTPGYSFDSDAFTDFLADQDDLGTKWLPDYVKVVAAIARTETNKILKRALRDAPFGTGDPVYVRAANSLRYEVDVS